MLVKTLFFRRRVTLKGIGLIGHRVYINIGKKGKITLGDRAVLADYSEILAMGYVNAGDRLNLNRHSRICAFDKIEIGNNVTIAQFVTILDHDHGYTFDDNGLHLSGYTTAPILIGDNVWIGDKVTILKGVTIGNNVIIAANSVINKNVPDNCIAGGIPARIIKTLNP